MASSWAISFLSPCLYHSVFIYLYFILTLSFHICHSEMMWNTTLGSGKRAEVLRIKTFPLGSDLETMKVQTSPMNFKEIQWKLRYKCLAFIDGFKERPSHPFPQRLSCGPVTTWTQPYWEAADRSSRTHSAFGYCQEETIVQRNKIYTFLNPCLRHSGCKKEKVDTAVEQTKKIISFPAHRSQDFFTGGNIFLLLLAFPLRKNWLVKMGLLGAV